MDVLVVTATPAEAEWVRPTASVLACGVGPVEAAAATARALALDRPDAVLHVGVAGARRGSGIGVGELVLGSEARYPDLVAALPALARVVRPDAGLLVLARAALPAARVCPIATSAAVGGSSGAPVEAMEGFAVLRAAQLAGVPALELRAVANEVEEVDRGRWELPRAIAALAGGGEEVLGVLLRTPAGGP